jgi:17beta-estradiol 17-dehydrogenase / very-long-chain 3-oxoacyl-CoA reductase
VFLTHRLLPVFMDRFKTSKQKSLIINLSSMAGKVPFAGGSVYCATKAFNDFFSRSVEAEDPNAVRVVSV